MKVMTDQGRRRFLYRLLSAAGALSLGGCDRMSRTQWVPRVLDVGETLSFAAQRALLHRQSMAQEFTSADLSPYFRSNGTSSPADAGYQRLAANGFVEYRLTVSGEVENPQVFSLQQLRALPSRTQITRHDCVEGWSAIGQWKGARLAALLQRVRPTARARYLVFYCADPMNGSCTRYYESIDMEDALHPQTILAYELNGRPLPMRNGAPIRLRVERQLGYKMAKYIMHIALVDSFATIGGGRGGYWEDRGYEWYAGI